MIATLECDHCGGVAIHSRDGYFTDGEGERCVSCRMPGHVVVDGDDTDEDLNPVHWSDTQEAGVYCTRAECSQCVAAPDGGEGRWCGKQWGGGETIHTCDLEKHEGPCYWPGQ